jgi:hypothetical protein
VSKKTLNFLFYMLGRNVIFPNFKVSSICSSSQVLIGYDNIHTLPELDFLILGLPEPNPNLNGQKKCISIWVDIR